MQGIVGVFTLYVEDADERRYDLRLERLQTEWILAQDFKNVLDVLEQVGIVVMLQEDGDGKRDDFNVGGRRKRGVELETRQSNNIILV